jgi:antitoxin component YwqK of YwqJK toxin-antitoxin module
MRFKLLLIFVFLQSCENSNPNKNPTNVPNEAKFDRKRNVYLHRTDKRESVYYASGKKYSECDLGTTGKYNGICNYYYEDNGKLLSSGYVVNGLRDKLWHWYFPNQQVYYRQEFNHEKRRTDFLVETELIGTEHGKYERFYDNGKLEERGSYDTGYKTGLWEKFYRSGKKEFMGNYKNNTRVSNWIYFFPNEKVEALEFFQASGEFIERKTFYSNGKPNCIIKTEGIYQCN